MSRQIHQPTTRERSSTTLSFRFSARFGGFCMDLRDHRHCLSNVVGKVQVSGEGPDSA